MEGTTRSRTGLDRRQWRGLYLEQDRIGQKQWRGLYLEQDRIGQTTVEGIVSGAGQDWTETVEGIVSGAGQDWTDDSGGDCIWSRTGLDRRQWRGLYPEQNRIGQTTVEGTDGGNYLEKDRIEQTTVEGIVPGAGQDWTDDSGGGLMEGTTWSRTGLDRRQWRGTDGGNYLEQDRIGQTTVERD